MTILRGAAAILCGLVIGGTTGLLIVLAKADMAGGPGNLLALPFMVAAGIVVTAPGWMLCCAAVLPVVTHRTRVRGPIARMPYYMSAAALGAVGVLPTYLTFLASDPSVLAVFVPAGIAGGVAIAAMWRRLILNRHAARRAPTDGAFLG